MENDAPTMDSAAFFTCDECGTTVVKMWVAAEDFDTACDACGHIQRVPGSDPGLFISIEELIKREVEK